LRRLAGVNAAAKGGKWEPAAEIPKPPAFRRKRLRAKDLYAISVSLFQRRTFKDQFSKILRPKPHS